MPSPLSGPGLGLSLPQNLYPSILQNAPLDVSTNRVTLNSGDALALPAGDFYVGSCYCVVQFLDPVTGIWVNGPSASYQSGPSYVKSDGFNCRIANMTGCCIGLVVANQGGSYVQGSTTIAFVNAAGGALPTAVPIIGGALAVVGATLVSSGAGHGVAPLALIPSPPPAASNPNGVGGFSATGYFTIASGTVSGFTFTNQGAGYPAGFTITSVPSPFDPNLSLGITNATIAFSLTNAGLLTGALVTNPGNALVNGSLASMTVTVSGAGTNATVSAVIMQTVVSASVTGIGTGAGASAPQKVTTVGGVPSQGTIAVNPDNLFLAWRPRPADIGLTANAGGSITTQVGSIYDGGLFEGTPSFVIASSGVLTAYPTMTFVMGGRPDVVTIQPAP